MLGLLVMGYGSPTSVDEIPAFAAHVRHGRPVPPQDLAELIRRYRSLMVASPLGAVTQRQAEALGRRLQARLSEPVRVYVGMKHSAPFVADTVRQMAADGVTRIIALPMQLLYSSLGVGWYLRAVRKELDELGLTIPVVDMVRWHLDEGVVAAAARRLRTAQAWLPEAVRERAAVVFTAHSQPESGDGYAEHFREWAGAVAREAGAGWWALSYRSAPKNPAGWLGPDVKDVIRQVAGEGARAVVICPLASVTENVEVLYEGGYDCQAVADELGLESIRTEFLNDADDFMAALADRILTTL